MFALRTSNPQQQWLPLDNYGFVFLKVRLNDILVGVRTIEMFCQNWQA
jgi:hypothetical protein